MRKTAIFVLLALSLSLLLFGCASAPAEQPASMPTAVKAQSLQKPAVLPTQPESPAEPEPVAAPPVAAPGQPGCTVQFQKDASNVFYVMVKAARAGAIGVTCPNGVSAQKQGELYFCTQLDSPNPAIAYLDGVECGRARFSQADNTTSAPAGKQSCTVLLSPSRITVGQTSTVTVKAYLPQEKSTLSYLCGDAEVNESAGGLVNRGKICKFNTPGTIEVYAKVNGEVCATSPLTVFSTSKDCSVYDSAFAMDREQYVYSAKVAARGYSGGDELHYKCYDIPFAIKANTIPNTTDFVTTIECRSASGPLLQNVKVTMGGNACGELVVAQ